MLNLLHGSVQSYNSTSQESALDVAYLVADVAAPGDCWVEEEAEVEQAVGEHPSLRQKSAHMMS